MFVEIMSNIIDEEFFLLWNILIYFNMYNIVEKMEMMGIKLRYLTVIVK